VLVVSLRRRLGPLREAAFEVNQTATTFAGGAVDSCAIRFY